MAIKDFKAIEGRKGYLVEQEDRKIFQKEIPETWYNAKKLEPFSNYDKIKRFGWFE